MYEKTKLSEVFEDHDLYIFIFHSVIPPQNAKSLPANLNSFFSVRLIFLQY